MHGELFALPDEVPTTGPLVTIMIASYNYARYLRACLGSAMMQNYENLEIVLVDNCSTDGSFELAAEIAGDDPRVRLYSNPENMGYLWNFRRCYELANGEYVSFLSADDLIVSGTSVAELAWCMNQDPEIALATTPRVVIDENSVQLKAHSLPIMENAILDGIEFGDEMLARMFNFVSESSTLFRKSLLPLDDKFYEIGGLSCEHHADTGWWLRIASRGKVAFLYRLNGAHRMHSSQRGPIIDLEPESAVEWFNLYLGAKKLGYLRDKTQELRCLAMVYSILEHKLGTSPDWSDSAAASVREAYSQVLERFEEVNRGVEQAIG